MRERVLITGASGFLGYHIIVASLEKDLRVYAAVRKKSNVEHLKELPISYVYLDYDDVEDIAKQLAENKIDYIIHAAGDTKALTQQAYDRVNATYTLHLAQAAEKLGSQVKKLVFISSLAAIGPLEEGDGKITEATSPRPVTAYGRSKLLAENYLAKISIPTTILRPTAVYGPRDRNIFIIIKMVTRGLDAYMGRTMQQLSFVHGKDVADVAVGSLFLANAVGGYNITDGNSYTRYQLSDTVKRILKRKAVRLHLPMYLIRTVAFFLETANGWLKKPSVLSREKLRELAAKNWICDISKARNELAFQPKFDLQKGMEDSMEWYIRNKWL